MSKKAWIIFAAVCLVVLVGLVYVSSKDKVDVSNVSADTIQSASTQSGQISDQVFGNRDSKVVLIEYGDFQCPGCGSAHPVVKEVTEKYKDHVAFVFRNFPLASIHPNARAAAAAAEAAGLQGKYWEMHNILYENQDEWSSAGAENRTGFLTGYAKGLDLNVDTFKQDLASTKIGQKINFDQAVGKKISVNATPTFYLNGKKVGDDIWKDKEKLSQAFADALKGQGVEVKN